MFADQCKIRGINIEDLDKGWVPQHKLDEDLDETIDDKNDDDEDDEDIDDDLDDDNDNDNDSDDFFTKHKSKFHHSMHEKSSKQFTIHPEHINNDDNDDMNDTIVTFKRSNVLKNVSDESIETENISINIDSNNSVNSDVSENFVNSIIEEPVSNHDRIRNALNEGVSNKPKIKLNIDPTKVNNVTKSNRIKLNIKQK